MFENRKIEIPEELDKVVAESLEKVEKLHKRKRIRRTLTSVCACAAAAAVFLVWGYQNPVQASKIPLIGGIFIGIENEITYSGDYHAHATKLESETVEEDKTVSPDTKEQVSSETDDAQTKADVTQVLSSTSSGITITAKEVYCDGYSAYLTLEIKGEESLGKIIEAYTEGYGDNTAAMINVASGTWNMDDGEKQEFGYYIEGKQIEDTVFQGMIKMDLNGDGEKISDDFMLNLSLQFLRYSDELVMNSNGTSIHDLEGNWNLSIPVTIDLEHTKEYTVDVTENGCSIQKVIVSLYEVKVIYTVEPLFATEEELHQEKMRQYEENMQYWKSIGETEVEMTPEEIDENTSIVRHKDQGLSVFDQDGNRLEYESGTAVENGMQDILCNSYPVRGEKLKELHLYIGEDAIACLKETDEAAMAARALVSAKLTL